MPCAKPDSCSSRNRIFRVPLSVKRTVPPQLSATASLPLPVATVEVSASTAVPGHSPPHAAALVRTVIANHPRCSCHCEPVTVSLVWQSVPPSPRPQARQPFFYVLPPAGYFCHQRQKYPKTPLETTFQDFLGALCPVPNPPYVPRVIGFSRVPLSVKRTVPPQLSATASLPLPVATVGAFPSTAVPGYFHPNATALVRTVIPSQSAGWRG